MADGQLQCKSLGAASLANHIPHDTCKCLALKQKYTFALVSRMVLGSDRMYYIFPSAFFLSQNWKLPALSVLHPT